MKYFLLAIIVLFTLKNVQAQTSARDTIEDASTMSKNIFYHNGQKVIGLVALKEVVSSNAEATKHMKKALNNYNLSTATGIVGGFVFGYSIGGLVWGQELNMPVVGASVGCIFLSYLLENQSNIHVGKAISIYNNRVSATGLNESSLHFGINSAGAGLSLKF
ncbi:MAG: hypothetical protein ACXWEY_12575 [Bacteroidia bacterium]